MAGIQLRRASAADKAVLFSVHETLFKDQIRQIWGWDDHWQRANFDKEWESVDTSVIEENSHLAGYVQIELHADHLYLMNLALLPPYQGRGLGGRTILHIQKEALKLRKDIRLSVFHINERALTFYQRHGFRIEQSTETSNRLLWSGNFTTVAGSPGAGSFPPVG